MARQCHLNTCPVGVATQREDLRKKFTGTPENAIRFFFHVADEVREHLASLGFRTLDEVIGRTDLLEPIVNPDFPRTSFVDFSQILADPDPTGTLPRRCVQARNDRPDEPLDDVIIADAMPALDGKGPVKLAYRIRNVNRTVGSRLAGEVAWRYGETGLPDGTIEVTFDGSAGQSFGAFCHRGVRLNLIGEGNDYAAKGMGGGEVVVRPSPKATFASHENVIIGNTCLYGATGGSLFVAGRAGERFAVRNSGARAVVEGVGDHGCEYMTEGVVVILGETGRNFGAGMSNGVAYVLDERGDFPSKLNPELVGLQRIQRTEDVEILRALIERHLELTGSQRAADILRRWDDALQQFWKVAPHYALTEEGPMTVVQRHLESLRAAVA
jgi:glutamate synthase (NADPH/NADH) large chain/glutamate synthase (ferredoxin)